LKKEVSLDVWRFEAVKIWNLMEKTFVETAEDVRDSKGIVEIDEIYGKSLKLKAKQKKSKKTNIKGS
jgi:hypothetical protein